MLTKQEKVLMDGCKLLGLGFDEFLAIYQILLTEEQVLDMIMWMHKNIKSHPEPMDLILAACEIQEKYKRKESSNVK